MKIKLEVLNGDEVAALIRKRPELARAVLDQAVEAAADVVLKLATPKAPGSGLDKERTGEGKYEVGPTAANWYYTFFETGTAGHLVEPVRQKALHWDGQFASRSHPGGIAAKPFLRPAVDEGKDRAGEAAGEVFKRAVE